MGCADKDGMGCKRIVHGGGVHATTYLVATALFGAK